MRFLSVYYVTRTLPLLMYLHIHGAAACSGAFYTNKNHIIRMYIKVINMFIIKPSSLEPSP